MDKEKFKHHDQKEKLSRRGFLRYVWMALVSLTLIEIAAVVISFLSSGGRRSSMRDKSQLRILGRLEDIPNGSVTAFRSDKLYLVRTEDGGLLALSLQCTHLGCAITWNKDSGEFDCPCHASSFNTRGEVISPPAPRALDMYKVVIEGGMVKADLRKAIKRNSYSQSQLTYA